MFLIILLTILPAEEHLVYDIKYGVMNAGKLVIDLNRDSTGTNTIKCTEKTTGFVSSIFKIDDWYTSISDSNFTTRSFEKNIQEGKYKRHQLVQINNGLAQYNNTGNTIKVIDNAKDIIGVWFWLRSQELIPDSTIVVPLHADKKNYHVKVNVESEQKNGQTYTLVNPQLKGIKAFGSNGEVALYYDSLKVPVEFKIKFLWGFLQAELKNRQWK